MCRFAHGGRRECSTLEAQRNNTMTGLSMGVIWIVVGLVTAGGLARRIVRARNRSSEANLGFISDQWIAEHRLSHISDDAQH